MTAASIPARWMLYNLTISPLSRYPGPLSARLGIPIRRFWHTLQGIGKNISLMELSKIIPEILLRYDIKKPIVAPTVQRLVRPLALERAQNSRRSREEAAGSLKHM
ncbi:uncharacterized protein UDID_18393 [Ustilago sp. UG-2017a]|nr:uncharacterized protein UDID_18393 [Ustilago sp. UG-2017a]